MHQHTSNFKSRQFQHIFVIIWRDTISKYLNLPVCIYATAYLCRYKYKQTNIKNNSLSLPRNSESQNLLFFFNHLSLGANKTKTNLIG